MINLLKCWFELNPVKWICECMYINNWNVGITLYLSCQKYTALNIPKIKFSGSVYFFFAQINNNMWVKASFRMSFEMEMNVYVPKKSYEGIQKYEAEWEQKTNT